MNNWGQSKKGLSKEMIDYEIEKLSTNNSVPYVEKNIKLAFLYYCKDFVGTATKIIKETRNKIDLEKDNALFLKENEKGINILRDNIFVIIFEAAEDFCGSSFGAFCCCFGLVAGMAICGISADQVCSFDANTGESGGCIGDCGAGFCNGIAPCCGCDTEFT